MTQKLVMIPGPTNVPERVLNAMIRPVINHRSPAFRQLLNSVREKASQVFQTEGEIVVLTASGTAGVEAAITNLIRRGDRVVVPIVGEFSRRAADLARWIGAEVCEVPASPGSAPSPEAIEEACEQAKPVKAIVAVYNDTSTGVTLRWLDRVGELATRLGAFLIVDAISILGGDELPVDRWGIDVCVTGSQKCLAGPPTLAILSISERAKRYMVDNPPPTLFLNLPRYFRYLEIGETPFTPAIPLFYALEEALNLVLEEGLDKRVHRHRVCAKAFYQAFQAMGLRPFAEAPVRSNTVIAVWHQEGVDDTAFRQLLNDEYDVLIAGGFSELKGRIFRVGSMGIVNRYHVLTTVSAISSALNRVGYHNDTGKAVAAALEALKDLP
jgi:aspartate aminotransferase-like enzyme